LWCRPRISSRDFDASAPAPDLSEEEKAVYGLLSEEEKSLDEIIRATGFPSNSCGVIPKVAKAQGGPIITYKVFPLLVIKLACGGYTPLNTP
jgi:hypothetical protein